MTTYVAVHCRASTYGDVCRLTSPFVRAECVDVRRHTQCKRGFRTTNDGATSVQMTVLEIMISLLHRLPNARRVGRHVWCNLMTIWWEKLTTKLCVFLVYMYYTYSCYQTSIFGKNCAYYIRMFTLTFKIRRMWMWIRMRMRNLFYQSG